MFGVLSAIAIFGVICAITAIGTIVLLQRTRRARNFVQELVKKIENVEMKVAIIGRLATKLEPAIQSAQEDGVHDRLRIAALLRKLAQSQHALARRAAAGAAVREAEIHERLKNCEISIRSFAHDVETASTRIEAAEAFEARASARVVELMTQIDELTTRLTALTDPTHPGLARTLTVQETKCRERYEAAQRIATRINDAELRLAGLPSRFAMFDRRLEELSQAFEGKVAQRISEISELRLLISKLQDDVAAHACAPEQRALIESVAALKGSAEHITQYVDPHETPFTIPFEKKFYITDIRNCQSQIAENTRESDDHVAQQIHDMKKLATTVCLSGANPNLLNETEFVTTAPSAVSSILGDTVAEAVKQPERVISLVPR
ncbi:MAG: hypothetical protein ACFBSD_04120 [Paracoccaceae bacterium]